jgi:hypothetical protein
VSITLRCALAKISYLIAQPYITKSYFSLLKPPTKLAKIAIGNGYMNSYSAVKDASAVRPLCSVSSQFTNIRCRCRSLRRSLK